MDISIILTYRCNSHCSMCHIWQHPTLPAEEVSPKWGQNGVRKWVTPF